MRVTLGPQSAFLKLVKAVEQFIVSILKSVLPPLFAFVVGTFLLIQACISMEFNLVASSCFKVAIALYCYRICCLCMKNKKMSLENFRSKIRIAQRYESELR